MIIFSNFKIGDINMKIIKSVGIGILTFFIIGITLGSLTDLKEVPSTVFAILLGLIAMYISFKNLGGSLQGSIADSITYVNGISSLVDDNDSKYFAIAEQEINDNNIDKGLWSQALVKSKGDENLRKVEYMKLRVRQIKNYE